MDGALYFDGGDRPGGAFDYNGMDFSEMDTGKSGNKYVLDYLSK